MLASPNAFDDPPIEGENKPKASSSSFLGAFHSAAVAAAGCNLRLHHDVFDYKLDVERKGQMDQD